jgi:hypothetical protein
MGDRVSGIWKTNSESMLRLANVKNTINLHHKMSKFEQMITFIKLSLSKFNACSKQADELFILDIF